MFDEDFVAKREEKQIGWIKRGIRNGNGQAFRSLKAPARKKPKTLDQGQTNKWYQPPNVENENKRVDNKTGLTKKTDGEKRYESFTSRLAVRLRECLSLKQRNGVGALSVHAASLASLAGSKNPFEAMFKKRGAEHWEQVALFDAVERQFPEVYQVMAAMPNGGHRSKAAAGQIKAEGGKKGYPDILIDMPRGIYHGMRIELKVAGGRVAVEQKEWHARLLKQGYHVIVAWSAEEAIEAISRYECLQAGQDITD